MHVSGGAHSASIPGPELPILQQHADTLLNIGCSINDRLTEILNNIRGISPCGDSALCADPASLDDRLRRHLDVQKRTMELLQELAEFI